MFDSPGGWPRRDRRALVIINSGSRGARSGRSDELDAALALLNHGGLSCLRVSPRPDQDPREIIRRAQGEIDTVIVAGGDGTINATLDVLVETRLPLGILPFGTANDFARTLGVPFDLTAAAAAILAGRARRVDVAYVNGTPFVNVATMGLGVAITQALDGALKKRWGRLAYLIAALRALGRATRFRAEIRFPDRIVTTKTLQIAVGCGRFHGGGLCVAEDAAPDDGWLDVYSLEPRSLWRLALLLPALAKGSHHRWNSVQSWRCAELEIHAKPRRTISADGEIVGRTPARFTIQPGALTVFAPPATTARDLGPSAGRILDVDERPTDSRLVIDRDTAALNSIIALCRDGADDCLWAAESVDDGALARFFSQQEHFYRALIAELERAVRDRGELPESRGTASGFTGRVASAVMELLVDDGNANVFEEMARAERRRMDALRCLAYEAQSEASRALIARASAVGEASLAKLESIDRPVG